MDRVSKLFRFNGYSLFGVRDAIERFIGYLKQRARRFHNINTWKTQSIEDYAATITIIRNQIKVIKTQGGVLLG
jgi:hypothetical protein